MAKKLTDYDKELERIKTMKKAAEDNIHRTMGKEVIKLMKNDSITPEEFAKLKDKYLELMG